MRSQIDEHLDLFWPEVIPIFGECGGSLGVLAQRYIVGSSLVVKCNIGTKIAHPSNVVRKVN